MPPPRIFLLSPARCDGRRAQMLVRDAAGFPLAVKLRTSGGAPIGDVFSFLSGLYFRGKLAYARAFTEASLLPSPIRIITTDRGLMVHEDRVRLPDLMSFATVDLAAPDGGFTVPFRRDLDRLSAALQPDASVVLLGSIATGKYVEPLLEVFGERLVFPRTFVGRGDMSRGGLLLRHARSGVELEYIPVAGAERHGVRPPKLERLREERRSP